VIHKSVTQLKLVLIGQILIHIQGKLVKIVMMREESSSMSKVINKHTFVQVNMIQVKVINHHRFGWVLQMDGIGSQVCLGILINQSLSGISLLWVLIQIWSQRLECQVEHSCLTTSM
jgi:hypothetical protein